LPDLSSLDLSSNLLSTRQRFESIDDLVSLEALKTKVTQ
jgi:hypothetical protein